MRKSSQNIFYIIGTIIVVIIFHQLITKSIYFGKEVISSEELITINASHKVIKVIPDQKKRDYSMDQLIYEFINNDTSNYNAKNSNNQIREKPTIKRRNNTNLKKTAQQKGDKLKYKEHNIHITKNRKFSDKTIKYNNMVQLGAFRTKESALDEWKRIKQLFPTLIKNFTYNIEKTDIKNQGELFRLKVGPFKTPKTARIFCNNLRRNGVGCFLPIS